MHYQILDFEFYSDSLVLTRQGEAISIRHNEAKVLALLLQNSGKVLSKDDILAQVWQDKVVSDQAVFQNISNLRGLLGSGAIKTFPKRGYQWQLDVTPLKLPVDIESAKQTVAAPNTQSIYKEQRFFNTGIRSVKLVLMAASVLVLLTSIVYFTNLEPAPTSQLTESLQIAYIPFTASEPSSQNLEQLALDDTASLQFTRLTQISRISFMDSMELEYPKLVATHPLVLLGEIRNHQDALFLDFILKGPALEWAGQIHAPNKTQLISALNQHLSLPVIRQLATSDMPLEAKQATLLLAHQQHPNDLIVLSQLVESYIGQQQLEIAMAMSEKLATQARLRDSEQQVGNALLLQSRILAQKELFELSQQKLQQAIESFEASDDLKRQADAWATQSWLDHNIADYKAIKTSLLKSAELSIASKDKQRELHALTYLSVLAHKHKQSEDKYHYLTRAEDKMRVYELPIYHFAKIPFHHAIYADSPAAKEPHLTRVIEYTRLTPDHWVAQSSRQQLLNYYIARNRLQDAQSLVENATSDTLENSYLKTLLAKANQDQSAFFQHAQRTFEQAQLAGVLEISLDVAALMLDYSTENENRAFYLQYIQQNAPEFWLTRNAAKLEALRL